MRVFIIIFLDMALSSTTRRWYVTPLLPTGSLGTGATRPRSERRVEVVAVEVVTVEVVTVGVGAEKVVAVEEGAVVVVTEV